MEDAFKFLLVIAVIVIGFIGQLKKEAKKKAGSKSGIPIPDTQNPLPEYWGGDPFPTTSKTDDTATYGGYIPEGPPRTEQPTGTSTLPGYSFGHTTDSTPTGNAKNKKKNTTSAHTPVLAENLPPESVTQDADNPSEFSIRSAEEARHAIIWSEILQRKY